MINFITGSDSTSAALEAERVRLEVIAQNIANANTTRGLDGKPYQRQRVVFENALNRAQASLGQESMGGPSVSAIENDHRPPRLVFMKGHPHADANGMVAFPNVNVYEEMADMIVASRSYEANLAVVKNSRSLAMQALSIGKR